ncbi:hypothetical protein THICB1_150023 [Thiomonas arsenitoxydans]|uniref:Uncharacterized protein n=2 Tax=Thiomonas TaxID=32012 RepID=A0A238D3Q6_THIDL|nr:hypothetical protein ACO3_130022 [Thiomonas arsenitoxydans]SBP87804.1 hypothetical protein THIARS_60517 [Thiomonas delicata]CQR28977.1 hypothetical protein ACO7_120023 [Thiomonas arsenitoxydans]CQR30422.1 hypothetical protein THICB1_150023 [Thiomonas arsenitoxydans]CQR35740.1 hypothetical protein THICB6_230091 [Thiomonas arsenitoxydans]
MPNLLVYQRGSTVLTLDRDCRHHFIDAITLPPDVPTPFGQHELIASSRELLDDAQGIPLNALGFAHDDNAAENATVGRFVANCSDQSSQVGRAV